MMGLDETKSKKLKMIKNNVSFNHYSSIPLFQLPNRMKIQAI